MRPERLPALIYQFRDVAADIAGFVGGLTFEAFQSDLLRQRGVTMSLIILGELADKTAKEHPPFFAAHQHLPWNKVRGLRNRLAHAYFEIDFEIIWQTATADVPEMAASLVAGLDAYSGS